MMPSDQNAIASQLFGPLADVLDRIVPDTPLFFLALDPVSTSVRFYQTSRIAGVGAPDQELDAEVANYSATKEHLNAHESLRDQITDLLSRGNSSERRNGLLNWAIHRLNTQTLVLGGEGTGRAPLHFQNVLDLAPRIFEEGGTLDAANLNYELLSEDNILRVPCYVDRPDLMTPETRPTFVAEYVYWLGTRDPDELRGARGLDFYFLPLRGLGQWRACADWIGASVNSPSISDKRHPVVSTALRHCLEALYSTAILDEFLLSVFDPAQARLGRGRIEQAFKSLWWAEEVAFFREGEFRSGFQRDATEMREMGTDHLKHVGKPHSSEGRFLWVTPIDGEAGLTRVVLSIENLRKVVPSVQSGAVGTIGKLLGCDQVQYACPRFDLDSLNDSRWDEQLGVRVARMAEATMAAAKAERTEAYESIGHTLKTVVQITGWRWSHQYLRGLARRNKYPDESGKLNRAANTLAMFSLAESIGGLVRLVGLLEDDEKLRVLKEKGWVDEVLLEKWRSGDAATILSAYFTTVKQVARALCLGVGWPTLHVSCRQPNGSATDYSWAYALEAEANEVFDVGSLSLPPLGTGTDGVFALLPCLLEPLRNALTAMLESRRRYDLAVETPLRVELEADLPRSIVIRIGNVLPPAEEEPRGKPPGLHTTEALLRIARVASFREPEPVRVEDGERVFWIEVDVHPVDLAMRILGKDKEVGS